MCFALSSYEYVLCWSFFRDSEDLAKILEYFSFSTSGFGAKSFPFSLPFGGCQEIMEL